MAQKELHRSAYDKVIGGVAGGLGDYFDIDPVIVRLLFVAASFVSGAGLVIYVVLWIVLPERMPERHFEYSKTQHDMEQESKSYDTPNEGQEQPNQTEQHQQPQEKHERKQRSGSSVIGGLILIVIGAIFLAENFIPNFDFSDYWPLILIAIGIGIIWNSATNRSKN